MPSLISNSSTFSVSRKTLGVALLSFLAGLLWRVTHVFYFHPPSQNIFSDMQGYVHAAQRLFNPTTHLTIDDTIFPPGMSCYLGTLLHLDSSFALATIAQFLISVLTPLLIAWLAWRLYDLSVGLLALILASLYFPYIDYAGFFLSEMPHTFFLLISLVLLVAALQTENLLSFCVLAFLTGLFLAICAAFKSVVLLPAVFVFCYLAILSWRKRWLRFGFLLGLGLVGMAVVLIPTALRCTRLSDGKFCLISNNGGMNVLLGHYGELNHANFIDPVRSVRYHFGLPASILRGYRGTADFQFGPYDGHQAISTALSWIKKNPRQALQLSFRHIADLFMWAPWPSSHQSHRLLADFFMKFYLLFILLPAFILIVQKGSRLFQMSFVPELLLVLPLVGLFVVAFVTAGEVRLRVPYDGLFLILAAKFYWSELPKSFQIPKIKSEA